LVSSFDFQEGYLENPDILTVWLTVHSLWTPGPCALCFTWRGCGSLGWLCWRRWGRQKRSSAKVVLNCFEMNMRYPRHTTSDYLAPSSFRGTFQYTKFYLLWRNLWHNYDC
jgi:hypothetical protein